MGEPLTKDELKTFTQFTGRNTAPSQRIDELWCCIGRRGGKSRAMAALAIYLAGLCDYSDKLSPGERGVVLLLAPDMKQAKVLLDYAEGTLESTPIMRQLIMSRTAETLTLKTGITLEVRSASFRRIRGVTCVAVLADECAFWMSDESANPDVEILNAARPALATTQGPLIAGESCGGRRVQTPDEQVGSGARCRARCWCVAAADSLNGNDMRRRKQPREFLNADERYRVALDEFRQRHLQLGFDAASGSRH
jgi:hypothetical protein